MKKNKKEFVFKWHTQALPISLIFGMEVKYL